MMNIVERSFVDSKWTFISPLVSLYRQET